MLEEQLKIEKDMHDGGIHRWNDRNESTLNKDGADTDWNRKLIKHFIIPVSEAIEAQVSETKTTVFSRYAITLDAKELAFITVRQMFSNIALHKEANLQAVCFEIASKVEDQVRFSKLKNKNRKVKAYINKIEASLKKNNSNNYRHKKNVLAGAESKVSKDDLWHSWPKRDHLHLGANLVKLACAVMYIEDEQVMKIEEVHRGKGRSRKTSKILTATGKYSEWISEFIINTEAFHPDTGPCIIPPRDWTSPTKGGYHSKEISSRNPLVKSDCRDVVERLTVEQMPKVYQCVNVLQKTRWCINTELFDVLEEVCKRDLGLGIPSLYPEPPPKNPLDDMPEVEGLRGKKLRKVLKKKKWKKFVKWKHDQRKWHEDERTRVSQVIDLARTRKLASKYVDYEELYFVYSLDSRQRFYARAPGLSPQGRDVQKGLLRFARRKRIGKHGHFWLKIHGANLWGEDKVSFEDRIAFVEEEEFSQMVRDIASDPIAFRGWVGADKPWQFLAWCFEYSDYLDHIADGKKSGTYKTFLAIAMDGSCSGIQHYSCMLRDKVGGKSVNLIDSDTPCDIYKDVADVVVKVLNVRAITGDCIALGWLAIGVSRTMTKIPVMTLPYGSTRMTCTEWVTECLRTLKIKEEKLAKAEMRKVVEVHTFGECSWEAERYLSEVIWDSIGEVVVSARHGMKFIRLLAKECAKRGHYLEWVTQTGFIVRQAVYKKKLYQVNTVMFGRIQFKVSEDTDELDSVKMQSSGPPNFIHSMDATHLVLSVCDMADRGIEDFWVVHDDFGTHCAQTGHLHNALRYQLRDMYLDDVLEKLLRDQEANFSCDYGIDNELPPMGELNLDDILTSTYVFS